MDAAPPHLRVFSDITRERARQDAIHGGPDHDDTHAELDWIELVEEYTDRAENARTAPDVASPRYRESLVKVAAIAVAAIESYDRRPRL